MHAYASLSGCIPFGPPCLRSPAAFNKTEEATLCAPKHTSPGGLDAHSKACKASPSGEASAVRSRVIPMLTTRYAGTSNDELAKQITFGCRHIQAIANILVLKWKHWRQNTLLLAGLKHKVFEDSYCLSRFYIRHDTQRRHGSRQVNK